MKPPSGHMIYWRYKGSVEYKFGYVTYLDNGLINLGFWAGDSISKRVVDPFDIEWKRY